MRPIPHDFRQWRAVAAVLALSVSFVWNSASASQGAGDGALVSTRLEGDLLLSIKKGDLTLEAATAIVNAANGHLEHSGGLAASIVRRGGAVVQTESRHIVKERGLIPTGQVAVTSAGSLPSKYVIHAVGPVWHGGDRGERELLFAAVTNSLRVASERGFESVALPAISSGIFGYPKEGCAETMFAAVRAFAKERHTYPRDIRFVNVDEPTVHVFIAEFRRQFPKGEEL